jgi:hypothetical protein
MALFRRDRNRLPPPPSWPSSDELPSADELLSELVDLEVEQVWVWHPVRLIFYVPKGEHTSYVDVSDFRFTGPDGTQHAVNATADPVSAAPVLCVLRHRVTAAWLEGDDLHLTFDNGAALVCPPHPAYPENWEVEPPRAPPPGILYTMYGP